MEQFVDKKIMEQGMAHGGERLVVLASASPRRKEILEQIGIEPLIFPSEVEEEIHTSDPSEVVMELSRQKAEWVAEQDEIQKLGDSAVIGSDTVVCVNGKILGKPVDREDAERMLKLLENGTHQVYTGVTLIRNGKVKTFFDQTDVEVYPMSTDEIRDYIACGESMDKAGAYGIQGRFAAYIRGIRGSYTNVMGLPAGKLYQELKVFMEDENDSVNCI